MSGTTFLQALEVAVEQSGPLDDPHAVERWLERQEIDRDDFVDTAAAICTAFGQRIDVDWKTDERKAIVGVITLALQTGFAAGIARGFRV